MAMLQSQPLLKDESMKYIKYVLALIVASVIGLFIYNEVFYNPLKDRSIKVLFPDAGVSIKMIHHDDFIGFGKDFFDIYVYKVNHASIICSYPQFTNKWEYARIDSTSITSTWLKCPIDSAILSMYKFEIDTAISDDYGKYKLSKDVLMDENNYYSYVFIDSHEKYFFFYQSNEKHLYYIKQRGF
jgi:hypothetical protein